MVFKGFTEVCAPQASDLHDVFDSETSKEIQHAVWNSQLRTQVIYGIKNTKVKDIRTSLIKQSCAKLNISIGEVVEDIWQDKFDKARFHIRYDTVEHRKLVAVNGFTITNRFQTVTVPKQQLFMGRIENVSPLFTLEIMQILLKKYGELHEIRFETYANSTISRRKLIFSYSTIHPNKKVPRTIELDGVKMQIIDQTSLLQCSHCKKYGHWSNKCNEKDSGVESTSEDDQENRSPPTLPKDRSDEVQKQEWPLLKESVANLPISNIHPVPQNITNDSETPTICTEKHEQTSTDSTPKNLCPQNTDQVPQKITSDSETRMVSTQFHEQTSADSNTLCTQKEPPDPQCDVSPSAREDGKPRGPESQNARETRRCGSVKKEAEQREKNDILDFFKVWDEEIYKKNWKHLNTY